MIILSLLGLGLLGSACAAMLQPRLISCALLLVGNWFAIAAYYLWAGAEFLAFAQVLVYVGAVSMVVLFAILLTRQQEDPVEPEQISRQRAAIAIVTSAAVAGLLVGAILASPFASANAAPDASVRALGLQVGETHGPALLITGLLLTVALLGAVSLASTAPHSPTPKS